MLPVMFTSQWCLQASDVLQACDVLQASDVYKPVMLTDLVHTIFTL